MVCKSRPSNTSLNSVYILNFSLTAQGPNLKRKHTFDKRNQNQRMPRQNFKNNSKTVTTSSQPPKKARVIPNAPTTVEKNKLKPFAGIANIEIDQIIEDTAEPLEHSNILIEDDEEVPVIPRETTEAQKPVLCGALTSLMCDYGTSDEETEEKENEALNKVSVTQANPKLIQPPKIDNSKKETPVEDEPKLTENKESDDEAPEEVKIVKMDVEHDPAPEKVTKKTKEKPVKNIIPPRKPEKQNYTYKRKIPSTLLQKLLHNEIRKERNIVLQCIRYIIKCNYFEKPNQ